MRPWLRGDGLVCGWSAAGEGKMRRKNGQELRLEPLRGQSQGALLCSLFFVSKGEGFSPVFDKRRHGGLGFFFLPKREGNGTVCVRKWGEGRRPQWQRGALWFFKGRVGQLGFLCLWPSEGDGRRLAKKEKYLGLGCFFLLPFPPVKNFLPFPLCLL
jgi:hypothetical protein